MAISISNASLNEIYKLSNEDKLDLVDLIIKSMRTAAMKIKDKSTTSPVSWVDQFDGKWIDNTTTTEEMVKTLRDARTLNSAIEL